MSAYVYQKEKLSTASIILTVVCLAFLIGASILVIWIDVSPLWTICETSFMALLIVGICLSGLYFMPVAVCVQDDCLSIRFPLRWRHIRLADIREATTYVMPKGTFRTCGSGGFMGYWGWHSNREIGSFFLYAANLKGLVYLRLTNGRKYVISTPDPDALLTAIKATR